MAGGAYGRKRRADEPRQNADERAAPRGQNPHGRDEAPATRGLASAAARVPAPISAG